MHTFAYGNLIDDATLSGGSWEVAHPLAELQERELALYAKSSTADPADTQIILSLIHISEPTRPRFGSRMPSSA